MTLDNILAFLEGAAATVGTIGTPGTPIGQGALLADYFLKIAQAAVKAHEATMGKPLDLNLLHKIDPV